MSPGADYDYPRTPVGFYSCVSAPNGTAGGALLYATVEREARAADTRASA